MNGVKRLGLHKINGLGLENNGNDKTLSIKFISATADDKNYNLDFEITASNLSIDKATIYVEEMNFINESAVPLTNVIINPNGKQNITVSFSKDKKFNKYFWQSGYSYQATINCDGQSASTEEFEMRIEKKKTQELVLVDVVCPKLNLTADQKNEFIATVFCETGLGEGELREIGWVYFNLVSDLKFETALDRSSAHRQENIWYKSCMCYITNKMKFKDVEAPKSYQNNPMTFGEKTFGDFVDSKIFKNNYKSKIDILKDFIEKFMFISNPKQKYKGWYGQGDWADMLIIDGRDNGKWHKARQYWFLQLKGEVTKKFVEILPSKTKNKLTNLTKRSENSTSFIYDEDRIIKYFNDNPNKLPEINNITSFKTDNPNGTFNLNFYLK